MAPISTNKLTRFLAKKKIATMSELKAALDSDVDMSIFRALKKLAYRTSYSHGGRFYALDKVIQFDGQGLWSIRSVWFSRHGTLAATLVRMVSKSDNGYYAGELEDCLHVGVKGTLLRLVKKDRIAREWMSGSYLYCSATPSVRKQQLVSRRSQDGIGGLPIGSDWLSDEVKAAIILFVSLLDEQGRRLFAGIQALQFGRGAERWIAELLGIHPQTVAKGRRELLDGKVDARRIRKQGAGRPKLEKKCRKSSRKSRT